LEPLSYLPSDHGYHHERSFILLSPDIRDLLGLCFCEHCLAYAHSAGVDAERVRERVVELVGAVFHSLRNESAESDIDREYLRAECDGGLGRYLDVRQTVVTSLVSAVAEAVRAESHRTRGQFLVGSRATVAYATGDPV